MLLVPMGMLSLVGLARVLIWQIDTRSRRFTVGMLAAATGTILFLPDIGEQTVDPAARFAGANTSHILTHLLTIVACYLLVAGVHSSAWTPARLRAWQTFCVALGAIILAAYLFSDRFRTPADQFVLSDPWSMTGYWALAVMLTVAFAVVSALAVANLRRDGVDLRIAMVFTLLFGLLGVAVGAALMILLAVNPGWLHDHYRDLITRAAIPALLLLAASGIPGLVLAWCHRHNPR